MLTTVVGSASAQVELLTYRQPVPAMPTGSSPAAVAEHGVTIDVAALSRSDRVAAELVLPDGSRYLAVPEAIERREGESFFWRGRLVGIEEEGAAAITVQDGHVAGLLTLPQRLLELVPEADGEGRARLLELDSSLFPECGGAAEPTGHHLSSWLPPLAPDGDPMIDVLVVYTARARQAAGGTAAIEATIQSAVDVTNDAYANSGVDQRIVLVHTEEVPYNETGQGTSAQLNWLRADPSVAALREAHHADMVALIPNELSGACGVGYVMRDVSPTFEAWAYSVTLRTCAVGNRTFAHELGHNMGLEHNPENSSVGPDGASYPWSFGHYVNTQFRTVMSYVNPCPGGCTRVGHFSNPQVEYNGFPTGIADQRENARSLNLTGPVVAAFRQAPGGPALGFDPPSLDFGDVELGSTSPAQAATLHNSGTDDANGLELTFPPSPFVVDTSDCGSTLEPGESCTISVTFTPDEPGAATAQLQAASLEGALAVLQLQGAGIEPSAPELAFDPAGLDFGEIEVGGTSPTLGSTLHNSGSVAATGLVISAPGNGFEAGTSDCGPTLEAGASCEVSIAFAPGLLGAADEQLQAESLEGGLALLALQGVGVEPGAPALELIPTNLEFGVVEVGSASPAQSSTLTNIGQGDATGLAFGSAGDDFDADASGCGTYLAPGGSCEISVTFTPNEIGAATAMLEVTADQGVTGILGLSGQGIAGWGAPTAMALRVDSEVLVSDGNGVLEPGELVEVAPVWRNDVPFSQNLSGTASNLAGPPGATYTLLLVAAEYGILESGESGSCRDTGACYQLGVNASTPRHEAHLDATFKETLSDGEAKSWRLHIGDSFTDVPRESPFYRSIETLLHHEVTGGCSETDYCPTAVNTRGQMPVFVLRAHEGADYTPPACTDETQAFEDVPVTSGLCPWIQDLFVRGLVAGCGEGVYCPNDPVNRQQMAIFLLRTLEGDGYTPPACTGRFDDLPCSSVFAPWVEELANRGVTGGCSADPPLYCPTTPVNRQQMAAFVSEAFGLLLYGP